MTLIIGFGHKARNGKDEAIKAIIAANPTRDIRRYGFGDALKREVNEAAVAAGGMEKLFPVCVPDLLPILEIIEPGARYMTTVSPTRKFEMISYDPNPDMSDPLCPYGKQRALLQWWGTEFRRAQDPDYWVKKTMDRIASDRPEVALICDLRFPNEMAGINGVGGYCVRVSRLGYKSDVPEHISEHALDDVDRMDWDHVIEVPDGNLEQLQEEAVNAFELLDDANRSIPRYRYDKAQRTILPIGNLISTID